ncbi:MAG: redoxin domain-containing protein [Acidobacteria bacterium]|nr:redoxin domain-containing protein [Acidobacteriota bacterium]
MQLNESLEQFREQGLEITGISYDSVAIVRHFSERAGIQFPLLADPDASNILAFGVVNTTVSPERRNYGIPFPGIYIIDENGILREKYFERNYRERFTARSILARDFGIYVGPKTELETGGQHIPIKIYTSDPVAQPGNRISLVVEFDLPPKMHLYAPGVEGYTPLSLSIEPESRIRIHDPEYPEPEILYLPAIEERVPVYRGTVRVIREVTLTADYTEEWVAKGVLTISSRLDPDDPGPYFALSAGTKLEIKGTLAYQACDDKVCYLPEQLPLKFQIEMEAQDEERVPR